MWAAKAAAVVAVGAATFTPTTTTVKDATGDVTKSPMDLTRVSLGRASNGELRASLTTAAGFKVSSMVAKDGIPATACLRPVVARAPPALLRTRRSSVPLTDWIASGSWGPRCGLWASYRPNRPAIVTSRSAERP